MNGYELIMKLNKKMQQDPNFAKKFNQVVEELNKVPGLQQEIMRIAQMPDDKSRQKAIDKLPNNVKKTVKEMLDLITS